MKNLKKVLSLVLASASALSVMAGAAFTDSADISASEAVGMLSQLGVINGYEDGSYKPAETVTRAEMAKMIYVTRTGSTDASAYENISTTFTDIKGHWAAGFIKYCQTNGIIAGKSATSFDPDATVTGTEATKMLLVTMGYTADKAGLVGSQWATNTLSLGDENGLLDDVDCDVTAAIPRQYAAQVIYNTLDAYRVKWSTDSGTFDYFATTGGVKETVGQKYLDLSTYVGTLTEAVGGNLTVSYDTSDDKSDTEKGIGSTVTLGGTQSFSSVDEDFTDLIGERVKVMITDDKTNQVLGVYATDDNTVYTVNASAVEEDGVKVKFGGTSYSIEQITAGVTTADQLTARFTPYNSGTTTVGTLSSTTQVAGTINAVNVDSAVYANGFADTTNTADEIKFVDRDSDGKLDQAVITQKVAAKVTYVGSSKVTMSGISGNYDPTSDIVDSAIVADDWAVLSYNRKADAKEMAKADVTSGTMSQSKTDTNAVGTFASSGGTTYNKYYIDGAWYSEAMNGFGTTDINTAIPTCTVDAVIVGGVVYKLKKTSTSATGSMSDVAIVVKKEETVSGKQVKLQMFDDTTKVVTVNDDDGTVTYANLSAGTAYEFSVNTSGEYSFNTVNATADYYGDFTSLGLGTMNLSSGYYTSVTGVTTDTSTYTIDDSADVILFTGNVSTTASNTTSNDSDVISGKEFKTMASTNLASATSVISFKEEISGLKKIGAMAVRVNSLSNTGITTYDNYGYIVTAGARSGSNAVTFTIWNGTENVQVTKTGTSNNTLYAKGMVVGYSSVDSDGYIKDCTLLDSTKVTMTALTSVSDAKDTIVTANVAYGASASTYELDVKSDSHVLYVDSDNDTDANIGVAGGSLRTANDYTGTNSYGNKIPNALVVGNVDKVELIIVDTANDYSAAPSPYYVSPTAAALSATASASTRAFGDTTTFTYSATSANIAVGTAVTPTVKNSTGTDVTASTTATPANLAGTLAAGTASPTVAVAAGALPVGTYTVTLTAGTTTTTATFTVTATSVVANDFLAANANTTTGISTGVTTVANISAGTPAFASLPSGVTATTLSYVEKTNNATMYGAIEATDVVTATVTLTPSTGYEFATALATVGATFQTDALANTWTVTAVNSTTGAITATCDFTIA